MSWKDSRQTCEYRPPEDYDFEKENKNVLEECYDCGKEIGEKEGCLSDGHRICDRCAYELTVSERPSAYYFDEDNAKFDNMAQEHFVEETQPKENEKMVVNQKFIDSVVFSNFKSIEEIKEKIKTFMLRTTYNDGFEDWSQRLNENGLKIHRIKVFKYILEVNEEPKTDENTRFTVSIYTNTVTIRYGGSLWNQFEACLDELSEYLNEDMEDAKFVLPEPHVYKPISRSYCDDPNADEPMDMLSRRFYNDDVVLEPVNCLLPGSVEELYAYLESQPVSILPTNAVKIDEDFIYCDTFEEAKRCLTKATCQPNDATQELSDSYIVSQYSQRYWYVLDQDVRETTNVRETTKFRISLYVKHDEVATKYLKRKLEECMYCIDYHVNPSDYAHEEPEHNWATVEELEDYYCKQREEDYSNYYTKKALCFTCGEVNYAEPVHETADRTRMVCCDCVEIINCCSECNTVTRDTHYDNNLCFECKFKDEMRWEKPLWAHLLRIIDIQHLDKTHFDILVDYAELCEFTIFDAYRYKSRCHYYDCEQRISPYEWDAEETLQFCCKRHKEYAEDLGCHTQTVYDCTHHNCNFEFEQATCKVCNSYHENNVADRIALRGVKNI
jgi:hypothetical protein